MRRWYPMQDLRRRARLIVAIMVAVLASMSLHHGAMASGPAAAHHHIDASGNCGESCSEPHDVIACCAMGLCLSGLPAAPRDGMLSATSSADHEMRADLAPRWMGKRIDRPPKVIRDTIG